MSVTVLRVPPAWACCRALQRRMSREPLAIRPPNPPSTCPVPFDHPAGSFDGQSSGDGQNKKRENDAQMERIVLLFVRSPLAVPIRLD